ncbi:aconitase X [Aureimonas phyllosphaerae]|uniref:2-methyl-cis-aconitate hydratase n=1 Tax=Aureimonas phyllosphaerae TaxID=1166078 RepID=A0A7W6FTZ6_9HYPH|nr:aconitase X [Aureimonas phyllosphaerae]MBB3935699.1 hypothetical protein [Aureimonas phyllosphaerae]MBB3959707.1 hypothetical protein [Aureimonas phyllosphaerae]SFF14027.1 predicted aconitase subunit 1 [Aureimonas phyllosphaerae]
MTPMHSALSIVDGPARGPVVALSEGLSFWGGVDPATGRIIDAHHPQCGANLAGAVVLMPTSRGSCSGSGVVLELTLAGRAPAALVFAEAEDVATLGALVAGEMFGHALPVLRLSPDAHAALARETFATIDRDAIRAGACFLPIARLPVTAFELGPADRAMLDGAEGEATAQAMRILVAMARQQGAERLVDVTCAHIDGCIYAGPANLVFAEAMAAKGARVRVPTTMNAISVDAENWRKQSVAPVFGEPAARLADAYVGMGCRPTFTCAPYLLDDAPGCGDIIGWSESNAVIFANSVLGARTAKHPDFLDLCIALTGRAPLAGPYLDAGRRAALVVDVDLPERIGSEAWPLLGYLAGRLAPERVPLLRGLADLAPRHDDLKALCAAFGTTSAAPMLHVEGVTPEAEGCAMPGADLATISRADLAAAWRRLNEGAAEIDLVAIGSPHASLNECQMLADALAGRARDPRVRGMITAGRQVLAAAKADGTRSRLSASGIEMIPDLCWCSISRPVFPRQARTVLTTSGKYAHYGPGLSGCAVRLGTLADCADALATGFAPPRLPDWLV